MSNLNRFPPEQWDAFLTFRAECYAPGNTCIDCIQRDLCFGDNRLCLVCMCFDNDCTECKPGFFPKCSCLCIPLGERVDALIERLYREGIFQD